MRNTKDKITFPLKYGMQGPEVANLQDALLIFLEKSIILPNNEARRREISERLKHGQYVDRFYGSITVKIVSIFQSERNLEDSGNMDENTAKAINAILCELGLLEQGPFIVSGVRYKNILPFKSGLVHASHEFEKVTSCLGKDTTDAQGRYTIRYELLPRICSVNLCVEAYGDYQSHDTCSQQAFWEPTLANCRRYLSIRLFDRGLQAGELDYLTQEDPAVPGFARSRKN